MIVKQFEQVEVKQNFIFDFDFNVIKHGKNEVKYKYIKQI